MKTVLDLVQEFASLDDTKSRSGGILRPPSERRWAEVKAFYDLVMVQSGLPERRGRRFTALEIDQRVVPRARLRVRVEIDLAVLHQAEYRSARVMDLSCGGILLVSGAAFEVGSRLTLNLANIGEAFRDTEGDVVWHGVPDSAQSMLAHRMGICFVALPETGTAKLDSFVVEILEQKLLALDPMSLDADFVRREGLILYGSAN